MSDFQQSIFDVDVDTMNSVFDNAENVANQFEYTTEAEEDDRMMGVVLGEDGTELPKDDELHSTEKSDLGDDKSSLGDGIFDDETDNTPKCDPARNADVIDRTSGAEGTKKALDINCPKNGISDSGNASDSDKNAENLTDATAKAANQTGSDRAADIKDDSLSTECAWLDAMYEEYKEGMESTVNIGDGIQDNGDASAVFDDDDVEDIGDQLDDAKCDSCDEIANMGNASGRFAEDDDLGLGIPDTINALGFDSNTSDLGLDVPDKEEGQVKDANKKFQSDLDESFLFEDDDLDDMADDSDSDSDTDDSDIDMDDGDDEESDAIDDSEDDSFDESFFEEDSSTNSGASYHSLVPEDDEDEGKQKVTSDQVQQMKQNEKKAPSSTNEDFMFEDDDIQDELNGVVDDEDMRDGEGNAVETKEGEDAPADDLDEAFLFEDDASVEPVDVADYEIEDAQANDPELEPELDEAFFMEDGDVDIKDNVAADSDLGEIEDTDDVEDIDDDNGPTPDLSYSEDDDELFDSINED